MNGENAKLYHEDNLYILGKWFAIERRQKEFSTRGLSRSSNINTSLISDIENQKTRPNLETLKELYKELDISFITDETHLQTVQENILSLYYAVYDQNINTVKDLLAGLKSQVKALKYSPITVDILIIESVVATIIPEYEIPKAFFALKNHLTYLSVAQKEHYYISLGYEQLKNNDYQDALESFHLAISFHREGRGSAVSHELIATIHSKLFDPLKAIEYSSKASRLHAKYSNITRKISSDFIQIKSYLELNQPHQAEVLIKNLSYVLVESNQRQWYELKSFETYLYYKKEQYEKSLELLNKIPQKHIHLELLHLQLVIHLKRHEEQQKIFERLLEEYDENQYPLENALIHVIHYPRNQELYPFMDKALNYLRHHFELIDEYDVAKDVVDKSIQYTLFKKDLENLEHWINIYRKLMKFEKF